MKKSQIFWLSLTIFASMVSSGFVVADAILYDITNDTQFLYRALFSVVVAIANIYNSIRTFAKKDEDELYEVK